jgi:hypothetical protein
MKAREKGGLVLLLGAVLIVGGCAAAVVGVGAAGTAVYMKGALKTVESKSLDAVYAATKTAANQLGLHITQDTKDARKALIIADDPDGKTITIKLKSNVDKTTDISIRVNVFGSEKKQLIIYQKIHDCLK